MLQIYEETTKESLNYLSCMYSPRLTAKGTGDGNACFMSSFVCAAIARARREDGRWKT